MDAKLELAKLKNKTGRLEYLKAIRERKTVTEAEKEVLTEMYKKYYTPNYIYEGVKMKPVDWDIRANVKYKPIYHAIFFKDIDGEWMDCGQRWLSGSKRTAENDIAKIYRELIDPQIKIFRMKNEISYDLAIDHVIPFVKLFNDFKKDLTLKDMLDRDVVTRWVEYHQEHAELQAMDRVANLRKSSVYGGIRHRIHPIMK